jgi:hypothetical protein
MSTLTSTWIVLIKRSKESGYGNIVDKWIDCEIFQTKELAEDYLSKELNSQMERTLRTTELQGKEFDQYLTKNKYGEPCLRDQDKKSFELIKQILKSLTGQYIYAEITETQFKPNSDLSYVSWDTVKLDELY